MSASSSEVKKEVVLRGTGVSSGVVHGPAFIVAHEEDQLVERTISEDEAAAEISRFEDALVITKEQLHEIRQKVDQAIGQENADIFEAHLMVVDDRTFLDEVIKELKSRLINVEVALKTIAEKYANALAGMDDDYLSERAADIRDVARRILRNLTGKGVSALHEVSEPCIVVASDLAPSETVTFHQSQVLGFATDHGSPTSHTAIMARGLEIPAVLGLHDVSIRVEEGDHVLIDGDKGIFIIHPSPQRLEEYGRVTEVRRHIQAELDMLKDQPAETRDGVSILLSANIELPGEIDSVLEHGAKGVGLFRTEFLYLLRNTLPGEEEQARAYAEVAVCVAPEPMIIRTLDIGGDKFLTHMDGPSELNPFLGCRAIRFCLNRPDLFKTQLRAILRASCHPNVRIMYPMISNVEEVARANTLLEEAKNELRGQNIPFNEDIVTGAMIEVPSASLTADLIARHVRFFSLGTNDLVQYTLAVDRVNEEISHLYEPTHPAILKLIKNTIDIGRLHDIETGICGEMAGDPLLAPLLLGLGAHELSVSPINVPLVKKVIRSIDYAQAEELARRVLRCESGKAVLELCRALIQKSAPEILGIKG